MGVLVNRRRAFLAVILMVMLLLFSGCLQKSKTGKPFDTSPKGDFAGLTLTEAVERVKGYARAYPDLQLVGVAGENLKRDGKADWREISLYSPNKKALISYGYLPPPMPPQAGVPTPRVLATLSQEAPPDKAIFVEDLTNQTPPHTLREWIDPAAVGRKNPWFWEKAERLFKPPYEGKVEISVSLYGDKDVWLFEVDWGEPVEKISAFEYKMLAKTERCYFDIATGAFVGADNWKP